MGKNQYKQPIMSLESFVPQEHFIRKLDAALDFTFIQDETREYCRTVVLPNIIPQKVAKYLLLIHLYDLERATPAHISFEKRIDDDMQGNMAYRWFLKTDLNKPVPSYNEITRAVETFGGKDKWAGIVARLLKQCTERGLPDQKGGALEY
jgi:transposase